MSKFIAFEGLDGSGSSTQLAKLASYLRSKGMRVHVTKEPTDNIIGGLIRGQLTKHWKTSQVCLQLLFAADRAHHVEKEIEPALKKGNVVLTDRYLYSTFAFGSIDGTPMEWLEEINKYFRVPDLTILLKVPPEICVERIKESRYDIQLFEEKKKLEKVWQNYEKLAEKYNNIVIIDGNRPLKEVFNDVVKAVEKIL